MGWYEILQSIFVVIVVFEMIINYPYYKNMPAFGFNTEQNYEFETIWHERFNIFVRYMLIIYVIMTIMYWILKYI